MSKPKSAPLPELITDEARRLATAHRELVILHTTDRIKQTPAHILLGISSVLLHSPRARLQRDGVGDLKFTVSELGSSLNLGVGGSALSAWSSAISRVMRTEQHKQRLGLSVTQ